MDRIYHGLFPILNSAGKDYVDKKGFSFQREYLYRHTFCQHFITAFAPGDCGAPLWFERTDGAKIIAAVVEGFNIIGDEPEGTYPKLDYVTLVANAEILNFISNVDRILSPAKDGEEAILETDQD